MTATVRDTDTAFLCGVLTSPRIGHFYYDVLKGRLFCLNAMARQLHDAGIPLGESDTLCAQLRTASGAAVRGDDLPLAVALRERRPVEGAFVVSAPGRTDRTLHISATPLKDADGQIGAVSASVVCAAPEPDWPALAGLAHDLRTPLQTVNMTLQLLEFRTLVEAERSEALKRLASAATRAEQIARDLLDWCQSHGAKGQGPKVEWFSLEPLLHEAVAEQGLAAAQKALTLTAVTATIRGWQCFTDRGRLARILANLLVNAVRYTPANGRVTLGAAWEMSAGVRVLVLEVRDTGAGISPHEQESIFNPFERGQTGRETDITGSGVGLAVVDRLTQELGLRCEVKSAAGHGSQFRILVPQHLLRMAP